jgi:hypothetical protein
VEDVELIEKDIFDVVLDNEEAKREAQKLLLSDGWYTTEAPQTFTPKVSDDGRRVANYFATIRNNKNPEETGKIGFRFSPDVRYKPGEDKADWNYRMFLAARKAFIEATGVEPSTEADVVRYIEQYPVQLRVVRTKDDENMVASIRAVKE